jgi:hypothetical protein
MWAVDPDSVADQLATMRSLLVQARSEPWEVRMDDHYQRDAEPIESAIGTSTTTSSIGEDYEGILGVFPAASYHADALASYCLHHGAKVAAGGSEG